MADMGLYINSASFGTSVANKVNDAGAGVLAGAYAAFVDSVTGQQPRMVVRPDGAGVDIVQTEAQNRALANWAEAQMLDSIFHRKPAGKVSYAIGPAFTPVAVKYAIPVAAIIFAAGMLAGRMIR
jgi:hypothetical protein